MPAPPGESKTWTIQRVLSWATDDFKERGFDSPRLEAEVLLSHVLGVDRVRLILDAPKPLAPEELSQFREVIKRRRGGEPVAYIIGEREFYGYSFRVDRRVLIPRPDTEVLVEAALEATKGRELSGRALDLCTGSGCVAIAFKKKRPTWDVTASDVSEEALEVARENALRLGAVWGLRFVPGNLFDAVGSEEEFDLVTANPPYIPSGDIPGLQPDIRDFEPRAALDGGAGGLDFIPRIARGAWERLTSGGTLAIEIGAGQSNDVAEEFERVGFVNVSRHRDYGGHERVVSARRP